jgi:hypothetical protein
MPKKFSSQDFREYYSYVGRFLLAGTVGGRGAVFSQQKVIYDPEIKALGDLQQ